MRVGESGHSGVAAATPQLYGGHSMQQRTNEIVLENFSFSVGRLVIKQTTADTEVSLPDTALKAIGQVVSAPQQLLGLESNGSVLHTAPPAAPSLPQAAAAPPAARPRRRRRATPPNGDGANGTPNGTHPDSARSLILELKREGFFKTARAAGHVVAKLHEGGHTATKPNNVQNALQSLTVAKELFRKQDRHKKYLYQDSPHDHD